MLNRLDIRLLDQPGDEEDDFDKNSDAGDGQYTMSLSFTGTNVIAGFRKLAELGVVDPSRMPSTSYSHAPRIWAASLSARPFAKPTSKP